MSKGKQRTDGAAAAVAGLAGFEKLQALVDELVSRYQEARTSEAALRETLAAEQKRTRALEEKLLGANQLRQDAVKHIDELVAQLDHLEAELERRFDAAQAD